MSEIDWLNKVQKNFQSDKDVLKKKSSYVVNTEMGAISQQQWDAINRSNQLIQQQQMNQMVQQEQQRWREMAQQQQVEQQMRMQQQASGFQTIVGNPFRNW